MATPAGYLPSFEDRLAEFFLRLSGVAGDYGKFSQGQEQLQQTESNQYLQRLLGFNQLESLNTERAQKSREFQQTLEEKRRAAQERETQAEQNRLLMTNIPNIFAPIPSLSTTQGVQAPSEFGGPGIGEGGAMTAPFMQSLTSRKPTPEERYARATEVGIDPGIFAKFSKEYRDATGETTPQIPKGADLKASLQALGLIKPGPGREELGRRLGFPEQLDLNTAKDFFEGKSETELQVIVSDPSTPPELRQIARDALAGIRQQKVDVSAAQGLEAQRAGFQPPGGGAVSSKYAPEPGEPAVAYKKRAEALAEVGVPKPAGVEERQARVYMETVGEMGKKLEGMLNDKTLEKYQGFALGVVSGSAQMNLRNRLNQVPDKLAELDQGLQAMQNRINRAMNGARASDKDIERVMREAPTLDDSPSRARVKLKATLENITIWERKAAEAEGRIPNSPLPQTSLPPGLHR